MRRGRAVLLLGATVLLYSLWGKGHRRSATAATPNPNTAALAQLYTRPPPQPRYRDPAVVIDARIKAMTTAARSMRLCVTGQFVCAASRCRDADPGRNSNNATAPATLVAAGKALGLKSPPHLLSGHWNSKAQHRFVHSGSSGQYVQVALCPSKKIGYLHVFKSGGTSVIALLETICPDFKLVCSSRMPWCQPFAPGMYDRMGVANYSFFTFVRDPLDRFTSAVYELAQRGNFIRNNERSIGVRRGAHRRTGWAGPHLGDVERHGGESVADHIARAVLEKCLGPGAETVCDRHLDLQIEFLNSDDGLLPLELVSHVGVMSRMTQQLPALILRHFGVFEHDVAYQMLNNYTKHRDRNSVEETPIPPHIFPSSKIRAEGFYFKPGNLSAAMRRQVRTKYAVDVTCLAGIV